MDLDFSDLNIGVVGDLMLDQYIYGRTERISQEAPVPVIRYNDSKIVLGGAANVANNILSLGADVTIFGIVGDDDYGEIMSEKLKDNYICCESNRKTTVKQRIISSSQQILRVDFEDDHYINLDTEQQIFSAIEGEVSKLDAIVIADYGKGVITHSLLDKLCKMNGGIMKVLDPHPSNLVYSKPIDIMTPNLSELYKLSDNRGFDDSVEYVFNEFDCEELLVTCGENGLYLKLKDGYETNFNSDLEEVFDVCGAGDTVLAAYTLARLEGNSPSECCKLANYCAGIVVSKLGTSVVTKEQLNYFKY